MGLEGAIAVAVIGGLITMAIWKAGAFGLKYLVRDYKKGTAKREELILSLQKSEVLYRYCLVIIVLMLLLFGTSGFLVFVMTFVDMHWFVEYLVGCMVVVITLIAIYSGYDCLRNVVASSNKG